ncbi:protein adenylyltransferase SelO [Gemmobacter sp.]|uniref:protein adenylyltransferase SelO n=1 Tax=Paracoccaceae TaxID=31989 RepID=UPI002AFE2906|nr:YdiU family protein [Gemmobacter sp.]HQU67358.1 YdiU family protein [Albidovulum sp.]
MDKQPAIAFDNSYARDLEGFYVPWVGSKAPAPEVLRLNTALAADLGLDGPSLAAGPGAVMLSGGAAPEGALPLAMAYAGHQFGGFSPQLGDGRALLLGEVIDRKGQRRDIHLKGSGRTPFSRGGDGKAVLGPVLREYLFGEAMHALGIPTTRALAATLTGEAVMRQNGPEPGAVLARVASSHLRVGTFQFFAARGEVQKVRQLADYAIDRHFPEIAARDDKYLELFRRVRDAQAALVAQWVHVGFVHGVMNTDNTTISGETIDYGPCAFIDAYDPKAVFSSIDEHGRYAFGNQPPIMQWNLSRFAETLIDLVNPDDSEDAVRQLTNEINAFPSHYQSLWLKGMRAKLGLFKELPGDLDLANDLLTAAEGQGVDYTGLFRAMGTLVRGYSSPVRDLFSDTARFDPWLERYLRRMRDEIIPETARAEAMDRVNPIYIPRNHLVDAALSAAVGGDMAPFDRLLGLLSEPFTEQSGAEDYARPAPVSFGKFTTYCGT